MWPSQKLISLIMTFGGKNNNPVSLSKQSHHSTDLRCVLSVNVYLSDFGKVKQGSRALGKIISFPDSHGEKVNMVVMSH